MRPVRRLVTAVLAVAFLVIPASAALGAPGDPGGGGGGGKPDKGDLYSDLWVIARDVRGVPITVDYDVVGEGDVVETSTCVQPITFDADAAVAEGFAELTQGTWPYALYPYDSTAYLVPLAGEDAPTLEVEPCDVADPAYADAETGYITEVDLGRLNLGRAPERVLSKQLGDVVAFLSTGTLGLDASGRFVHVGTDETLDSPLANIALYQAILEDGPTGALAVVDDEATFGLDPLELTAAAFAAGAPKEDFEITVDTVQYLNRILGIPAQSGWGVVTPTYTGETGEEFLDLDGFAYDRDAVFPGCVSYYTLGGTVPQTEALQDVVPFTGDPVASGIDGYARFAEDARDVLVWVHDQGILVTAVDPITTDALCTAVAEDVDAPELAVTSPDAGAVVEGTIGVTGTATDATGVARVEVGLYDAAAGAWAIAPDDATLSAPGGTSTSFARDLSGAADGVYKVYVRAYDTLGNRTVWVRIPVTVGAVAP